MAKNKINKILTSPDKEVKKTFGIGGILSRLFRQILADLNITPSRFGSLMQDYVNDPRNSIPNNKRDQTMNRGNLIKEFSKPNMTWKVFCKAMRFLQFVKIDFVVRAYHRGYGGKEKEISLHMATVNFAGEEQFSDDPSEKEEAEEARALANSQYGLSYLDRHIVTNDDDKETSK